MAEKTMIEAVRDTSHPVILSRSAPRGSRRRRICLHNQAAGGEHSWLCRLPG